MPTPPWESHGRSRRKSGWNPWSFRVDEEWVCDSQVSDRQSISALLLAQRISKSTRRVGADKLRTLTWQTVRHLDREFFSFPFIDPCSQRSRHALADLVPRSDMLCAQSSPSDSPKGTISSAKQQVPIHVPFILTPVLFFLTLPLNPLRRERKV